MDNNYTTLTIEVNQIASTCLSPQNMTNLYSQFPLIPLTTHTYHSNLPSPSLPSMLNPIPTFTYNSPNLVIVTSTNQFTTTHNQQNYIPYHSPQLNYTHNPTIHSPYYSNLHISTHNRSHNLPQLHPILSHTSIELTHHTPMPSQPTLRALVTSLDHQISQKCLGAHQQNLPQLNSEQSS